MPRRLALVLLVGLAAAAPLAAAAKFRSTWKNPDVAPIAFTGQKVAALVMSDDLSLRMSAEEALARDITALGVQGVAAHRLIPSEELKDKDKARGWFERTGVQGVVVMRPVSVETSRETMPIAWTTSYYGTLWDYYGYGWGDLYAPTTTRERTIVAVETLVYSVPKNALLWAGMSESKDPKDLQQLVADIVKAASGEMRKHGMTAR